MKVIELIALLDECDPDAEVRIATQPSYPLQSHVRGIATTDSLLNCEGCEHREYSPCDDCRAAETDHMGGSLVWIAEGSQVYDNPYAPRAIWDAVTY